MNSNQLTLNTIPVDLIYTILKYCDDRSLYALSCCCRRFFQIINDDYVWKTRSAHVIATNQRTNSIILRSCCRLNDREKCKISSFWRKSIYNEIYLIKHQKRYLPWLSLQEHFLWFSQGDTIFKYKRNKSGSIAKEAKASLCLPNEDVCRFIVKDGFIISGGRKGSIAIWYKKANKNFSLYHKKCHVNDINCIDSCHQTIVSGSKDKFVKIWSFNHTSNDELSLDCNYSLFIGDRIWSLIINEAKKQFVVGSAACANIKPLQVYDIESGQLICKLGNNYRRGAGVLDLICESENEILSCGYDTCIRLWDLRQNPICNVLKFEDPHDSAVYCMSSDHYITILSGTARYGLTRLWDKRYSSRSIQMFYVGNGNSPVYSLSFDPYHAYIALDYSINLLSFAK